MRLEKYINEVAGDTSGATNMEVAIVDTWNNNLPLTGKYANLSDGASKIVEFLKSHVNGKATHYGSGSVSLSKSWVEYGGTDKTPKTDLIIGRNNISLKKIGPSQLMSGKRGESMATFYSVADHLNLDLGKVINDVEWYLNDMIEGYSDRSITAQKETGQEAIDFAEAEKKHKEFSQRIQTAFKNNALFNIGVIREAMTGEYKFDTKDAVATHLLVFDETGTNNTWHPIDESYVRKVASKTKVVVSWKSTGWNSKETETGKKYSFFSVLRLSNTHLKNEMKKYEGQMLTEGMISNLVARFKRWLTNLWKQVKNWLMSSTVNMLSFFNLEAEVNIGTVNF